MVFVCPPAFLGVDGGFGFIAVDLIKGIKVKGDTIRGMLTSADSMACA